MRLIRSFSDSGRIWRCSWTQPILQLENYLTAACKTKSIPLQWQQGHKSNALLFKRYTLETRLQHPTYLSPESWRLVRDMEWTESHRERLDQELYSGYASGDWYSVVGTQFDKSMSIPPSFATGSTLIQTRRLPFIFPHILWDAALFWGKCLFRDFEEWFVETVRLACANDRLNWVIKIHPANRRVRETGSLQGEYAEVVTLRKYIGELPPHIVMIPPESEISTYSLFPIMDYCLTVYGTVGMEAARLGYLSSPPEADLMTIGALRSIRIRARSIARSCATFRPFPGSPPPSESWPSASLMLFS